MNNAGRVVGIAAAFYNAIRAERKGGPLNQCASITFIVPRKYVRISPETRKGNTRANARYYLPLLAPDPLFLSPSLLHSTESLLIAIRRRERPGEGYYPTPPPPPPSREAERDKLSRAIISNSFHANPRRCFTTFSPSVLLIAA